LSAPSSRSRFIALIIFGHLGVERLSMVVVPSKNGVDFAEGSLGMLLDDLLSRKSLPRKPDDVTDGHSRAGDAQSTAADIGSANECGFKGCGHGDHRAMATLSYSWRSRECHEYFIDSDSFANTAPRGVLATKKLL
jgi:hypothetical protein